MRRNIKNMLALSLMQAVCYAVVFSGTAISSSSGGNPEREIGSEVEIQDGAETNIRGARKVTSDGKIINKSEHFNVMAKLTVTGGAGTGGADTENGVIHNHSTITVHPTGSIAKTDAGTGTVINYRGFREDVVNTTKINTPSGDDPNESYTVEGGGFNDAFLAKYDSRLETAAYFELVNETAVTQFNIYGAGKIECVDGEGKVTGTIKGAERTGETGAVGATVVGRAVIPATLQDIANESGQAYNLCATRETHTYQYPPTDGSTTDDHKTFAAHLHSVQGYTPLGDGDVPPSGATEFNFNKSRRVYIPGIDENLIVEKTGTTDEYDTEARAALSSFGFQDWKDTDPCVTYTGNNSWYNGVFHLKEGGAVIDSDGAIFGGKVIVGGEDHPVELEWRGGAKDEYNRPQIEMHGNSTLYFNIPDETDATGNRTTGIFSLYGSITGTETDRLVFEKGTVLIKGDCSGFKGTVVVVGDSKFEVRSSDPDSSSTYTGSFPAGVIYQTKDSSGTLATAVVEDAIEIDSANLDGIELNNGYTRLVNSEGKVKLTGSTVKRGAVISVEGESEIKDNDIEGTCIVKCNMNDENVTISGGVLALENESTVTTENLEAGSTIAMWGDNGVSYVRIGTSRGTASGLTITDGHTLKFFTDINPTNGTADRLITQDTTVVPNAENNRIQVGGLNLLSLPTQTEHRITLVTGAAQATPIEIGAVYGASAPTFVAYHNATFVTVGGSTESVGYDVVYAYTATTAGGIKATPLQTTLSNGVGTVVINGTTYYVYGSQVAGPGQIMLSTRSPNEIRGGLYTTSVAPTHIMHIAGFRSISSFYGMVTDDYGYVDKEETDKYTFWDRTFAAYTKYDCVGDRVKSRDYGTIFGFDGKPMALTEYNVLFIPTIFAGISHNNMSYMDSRARQESYIIGGKGTCFNKKFSTELLASYEYLNTHTNVSDSNRTKVKSHLLSVGAKFGYNYKFNKNFTLRPDVLGDYSFIKTPNINSSVLPSISSRNLHRFDIVPGLNLIGSYREWKAIVAARYHYRFGTKPKSTVNNNTTIRDIDKLKRGHVEYVLDVTRYNENKSKLGLMLSKTAHGISGVKATIRLGVNF